MPKKKSASSRHEKRPNEKRPPITEGLAAELAALKVMTDDDIDTSDAPEKLDWSKAEVGKFYRPLKEQISMKVDADVLHWFKAKGKRYTTLMNEALRLYVDSQERH